MVEEKRLMKTGSYFAVVQHNRNQERTRGRFFGCCLARAIGSVSGHGPLLLVLAGQI